MIRKVTLEDAAQICEIYNYYIENTVVSFEETPVTTQKMASRIQEIIPSLPWIVYEVKNQITGYAYASKWKGRCAYRYSVESLSLTRPVSNYMRSSDLRKWRIFQRWDTGS